MLSFRRNKTIILILLCFLSFYFVWLNRAYLDVIWMDQVQWVAGNINHLYKNELSLQDFFYLTPYIQSFSVSWSLLNARLFSYNTFIDNIGSGVVLFLIACYLIKSHLHLFTNGTKLLFAALAGLVVFGLHKWEASLNGMGLGFYLVFFAVLVSINLAHKYYLRKLDNAFLDKNFIPIFLLLVAFAIIEYGPYYVAFQISMIGILLVNYKVLNAKIDKKRWKMLLLANITLTVFAFLLNYTLGLYAGSHAFDGYPKAPIPPDMNVALQKVVNDPLFVVKFFLMANTGNLLSNESYLSSSTLTMLMPLVGITILALYGFCIYVFVKHKKAEYVNAIHWITFVVIFYALVTLSRVIFNDVYYGTSSRYTAATFSGMLGVVTILLSLFFNASKVSAGKKWLYLLPIIGISICYVITNVKQWQIAPYRKLYYQQLAENLKLNKNLESLQGFNVDITQAARKVMIEHGLNVFKPKTKLNNYTIDSSLIDTSTSPVLESVSQSRLRWNENKGEITLPNLYTHKDFVSVSLFLKVGGPDTPLVYLNDDLRPARAVKLENGFTYVYPLKDVKTLFKATILGRLHELKVDSTKPFANFRSMTVQD